MTKSKGIRLPYGMPADQRLRAKVPQGDPDACWNWTESTTHDGYGRLEIKGRGRVLVHRLAWEITYGPIPEGTRVCHRCDNPPCCNPAHLFLGTQRANVQDMAAKGRGHWSKPTCRRGHPWTPENTYRAPDGRRACKTCRRATETRYRRRVKHRAGLEPC